jgi:iron complex outermembrane receptor protein
LTTNFFAINLNLDNIFLKRRAVTSELDGGQFQQLYKWCRMKRKSQSKVPLFVLAGACFGTLASLPAAADAGSAPTDESLAEISVTASRLQRTGFNAPTPTTVIGVQMIEQRGLQNIADVLNEIPSFADSVTPSSSGSSTTLPGANYLNLRGLGTSRTLVLVDGRRHVPTDSGGEVDLNAIPTSLIDRVEVVTGGASAAWGSDAVAGVVNLILKDKLDGFTSNVQYGKSQRGDDEQHKVSLAFGTPFAGGRGQFMIAGEYSDDAGVPAQSDRRWGAQRWTVMSNPAYTPTNGQPARLIVSGATISLASAGGVIIAPGQLAGTAFGPGSTAVPFKYGSPASGLYMVGGDGGNFSDILALQVPVERKNIFTKLTFDLNDYVSAYTELSAADSWSKANLVQWPDIASISINSDNAYLPAQVRTTMQNDGISSFVMGRINNDFDPMITAMQSRTYRAVAGLKGKLGGDWTWDAYVQNGQSRIETSIYNNQVVSRFNQAVDAVNDPVTGNIVCRSTLTNPGDGCVPFNTFGPGSTTRQAYNYVTATQSTVSHRTQNVASLSFKGTAFSDWAGPVSVATGAEYREEKVQQRVDDLSAANAFIIGNPQPLAGAYNVKEVFAETVVPLLTNLPLAQELDLNVAGRLTDYSTSGNVTTWKAGLSWTLNDSLRFRATRSRDIRAPNLPELYTSTSLDFVTIVDPKTNAQSLVQDFTRGNLLLQPEKADTTSFGVVYQPSWARGLRASVDYYNIDINDAIGVLDPQDIVNRCNDGATSLCSLIARAPGSGEIASVITTSVNLQSRQARGFDIETSYNFPLSAMRESWGGDMELRLLGTHVLKEVFNDGVTAFNLAGQDGPLPDGGVPSWMLTASGQYKRGPFSFYLESRFISSGTFNNTYGPLDINDNSIPSVVYFNTSARYTLVDDGRKRLEIYGVINNLLDKDPPIAPVDFAQAAATNLNLYDVVGRNFSVGARFDF